MGKVTLLNGLNLDSPAGAPGSDEARTQERVMKQPNDLELIRECLEGDSEAFSGLVHRYQDRLYGAIHQLLHDHTDAQDVVQDAFLLAYQSLASFQNGAEFYTWLYRIAVNAALTMKRKRRPLTGLEMPQGQPFGATVPDQSQGWPGAALEQAEQIQYLQQALDRLSKRERALLLMKSVEGHTYEEISEILNIPSGTVRSRLHRARLKLRDLLERRIPSDCGF